MGLRKQLRKLGDKVVKNAAVIAAVVSIVVPGLGTAIGAALGATGTTAAVVGNAALAAGAKALDPNATPKDILIAGAAGGASAGAGQLASGAVKSAQAAGSLGAGAGVSSALPAAAGSAAAAGAGNLVYTGDVGEALKAAAVGGVAGGVGQLASTGAQQILPSDVGRTTQGLVAGGVGGATEAAILGQDPLTGALLSAGQTAAQTKIADAEADRIKIADAEADRIAREKQIIAAFEQPKSPGVGTQIGEPTVLASNETAASLPGYTVTDVPPGTLTPSGKPVAGRFDPTTVTGEATGVPTASDTTADILETILAKSPTTPVPSATPSDYTPPLADTTPPIISPVLSSGLTTPPPTQPAPAPVTSIPEQDRAIMDLAGITPAPVAPAPEQVLPAPVPPVTAQPPVDQAPSVVPPTVSPEAPVTQAPPEVTEQGMVAGTPTTVPPPPAPETPTATEIGAPTNIAGGMAGDTTGGMQSNLSDRDRQILDLTGITPPPPPPAAEVPRLPEVEVTARPEDAVARPEEDVVASQEFPLTQPSEADRRLIDYMYGNFGSPFNVPLGQMAPGSSALAQALSVGDPGALYLGKKGRERKPVWNVESLKLTDELGGTYG